MRKKHKIEVRKYTKDSVPVYANGTVTFETSFEVVETIERTTRSEVIGNFCPVFCSYNGDNRCLVQSDKGDLSDPFRADETYAESLYIKV